MWYLSVTMLVAGLFAVLFSDITGAILGLCLLVGGVAVLWLRTRPFRFVIDANGLDIWSKGVTAVLPWTSVDQLILVQPTPVVGEHRDTTLVLVPGPGVEVGRPARTRTPDGREGVVVLIVGDVREPLDEIVAALRQYGGPRFVDTRAVTRPEYAPPEFTVVPQGYEQTEVERVVGLARCALGSDSLVSRLGAWAELEKASFAVGSQGFDQAQVDDYIAKLRAALGKSANL
jgi:hypothetical protein